MSKELCFVIEEKELYMEQILVDYENIPVFYVCNDGKKTYLVLRRDLEQEMYVIVAISLKNLSDMLHGKITMRKALMCEKEFWAVSAGEEISGDEVLVKPVTEMPLQDLPYEGAYFQIADPEMETYAKQVDGRLLDDDTWESFWQSAWNDLTGTENNWLAADLPEVEIADIMCEEYITKFSSFVQRIHANPLLSSVFTEQYEWSVKNTM